jgi:hypothetical protein
LIKEEFPWGRVIDIHCIDNYQIVEFERNFTNKLLWHGYIDYKDSNKSFESLNSALIGCMNIRQQHENN